MDLYRGLLFSSLVLASGLAQAQWGSSVENDPMEGKVNMVSTALPDSTYRGDNIGTTAMMGLACMGGNLDIMLITQLAFQGPSLVQMKIDDAAPEKLVWTEKEPGDQSVLVYPGDTEALFHSMRAGNKMIIRMTRRNVGQETMTVSLAGFTKASNAAKEACAL